MTSSILSFFFHPQKLTPLTREKWDQFTESINAQFLVIFSFPYKNNLSLDSRRTDEFLALFDCARADFFKTLDTNFFQKFVLRRLLKNLRNSFLKQITEHNELFYSTEKTKYNTFFSSLGKTPLSDEQIAAVISDESVTLLNAAAGSGKTSVIASKVIHLVKNKNVSPNEILLLSFSKKAASELTERIMKLSDIQIKAKTLHSFGNEIYKKVNGKSPSLAFSSEDGAQEFSNALFEFSKILAQDRHFQDAATKYFGKFSDNLKPSHSYKDRVAYIEARRRLGDFSFEENAIEERRVKTFSGIFVRSFEEKQIADFLYLNDVQFIYEKKYPFAKNYHPDFYLPKYDLYLEHFALNRDGKVPSFFSDRNGVDATTAYVNERNWKLKTHNKYRTSLAETFSYDVHEGNLEDRLTEILSEHNCPLAPIDRLELTRYLVKSLHPLIKKSIESFKLSGLSVEELEVKAKNTKNPRYISFLEIFKHYLACYEEYLRSRDSIDFSDLLILGKDCVRENFDKLNQDFKYIIVDEFQDTSNLAMNFLKTIWLKNKDGRFFFVGDDWQSIYGFNGSDYTLMSELKSDLKDTKNLELCTNYRSTKLIVDLAQNFIKINPAQTQKETRSSSDRENGEIRLLDSLDLANALDDLLASFSSPPTILLLSRNNKDLEYWKQKIAHPHIGPKNFLTIHASKGGEAELVILLPSITGFPAPFVDDPFLSLFKRKPDTFSHSEERRVLYVALTRAKKYLWIVNDQDLYDKNFYFLDELKSLARP